MLYKYNKTLHKADIYHKWVRHLVLEVWCRATSKFETSLLLPEFETIVNSMPSNYLLDKIANIHNKLIHKPKPFKRLLHDGFRKNNSIAALCNGTVKPLQYETIKKLDKEFANDLYMFSVQLYDRLSKNDVRFRDLFGGINGHYNHFFSNKRNVAVCPFCGIAELLNSHTSKREAYDHFFPKEIYPFNTVNFENLVPMCHTCNSKYKTRKDPLNIRFGGPEKVLFYPFRDNITTSIDIEFTFNSMDVTKMTKDNVDISITSDNSQNKVERWKELFGVEERYKSICCDETAYKGWLEEYRTIASFASDLTFQDYIAAKELNPFLNKKFLEVSYLKACDDIGII